MAWCSVIAQGQLKLTLYYLVDVYLVEKRFERNLSIFMTMN